MFVILQALTVLLGAILKTGTIWTLAEIVNGLMAIPNLIMLLKLRMQFINLVRDFWGKNETGA